MKNIDPQRLGMIYYWGVFTGLLVLTATQLVSTVNGVEIAPSSEKPILFASILVLFFYTAVVALLVFWEHQTRYGWTLAIIWLVFVGIPVIGPMSYLLYWLSRINGLPEKD